MPAAGCGATRESWVTAAWHHDTRSHTTVEYNAAGDPLTTQADLHAWWRSTDSIRYRRSTKRPLRARYPRSIRTPSRAHLRYDGVGVTHSRGRRARALSIGVVTTMTRLRLLRVCHRRDHLHERLQRSWHRAVVLCAYDRGFGAPTVVTISDAATYVSMTPSVAE